jgi:thymidylate kinase
MAKAEPDRWLIVDGTPPKDELAATIVREVTTRLNITVQ